MNLRTLNDVFFVMLERNSDRVMLSHEDGGWKTISAVQLRNCVYATARQLRAWGIKKGDSVILLSENRPEWAIADFACLLLGIVDRPDLWHADKRAVSVRRAELRGAGGVCLVAQTV